MTKFSDRLFLWESTEESDRPICSLVLGDKYSILFDAGNSEKHATEIKQDIIKENFKEPEAVLISHSHCDHWFGLSQFGCLSIASAMTVREANKLMMLNWNTHSVHERVEKGTEHPITEIMLNIEYGYRKENIKLRTPDVGIDKRIDLDLGNVHCIFEHVGGNHSADSSILYVEEESLLFLGDILYLRSFNDETINELYTIIKQYNAKYYIDSHRNEIMDWLKLISYIDELKLNK